MGKCTSLNHQLAPHPVTDKVAWDWWPHTSLDPLTRALACDNPFPSQETNLVFPLFSKGSSKARSTQEGRPQARQEGRRPQEGKEGRPQARQEGRPQEGRRQEVITHSFE